MTEVTCCKKGLVYTFLGLNIFLSLLICFFLSLGTYDTIFLDWYQYLYLVVAYIDWLLLFCTYVAKLVLILIGKLPTKYVRLTWMVLNIPASVFFLIAFIFDLVMLKQNEISWSIYVVVLAFIFLLFIVFTAFDFFLINIQIEMAENNGSKLISTNIGVPSKSSQVIELKDMRNTREVKVMQKQEGEKEQSQNDKIKGS